MKTKTSKLPPPSSPDLEEPLKAYFIAAALNGLCGPQDADFESSPESIVDRAFAVG
jgi:hypothetical protein